jgi:hypothetical protein
MAVQVHHGLFVGNASDLYKFSGSILHCARDPWFYEAQTKVKGLVAMSSGLVVSLRTCYNEMALNMVDADHPKYFSDEMVNAGLEFISERMAEGDAVLCHCNMGLSRSPSVAFLWLYEHGFLDDDFRYALPQFKDLYPDYSPANGIWQYLKNRCSKPTNSESSSL